MGCRAAVVFGGAPVEAGPRLRARLAALAAPFVVAADGGAAAALALGYPPRVLVGDLDSISDATLAEARARGAALEAHPRDKDATDGQLAAESALRAVPGADPLVLVGFVGGPRLDQTLANALLLARLPATAVVVDEHNECRLARAGAWLAWRPEPGEVVSLVPVGGDAEGVRTEGLRWGLAGERLGLGQTRGVSNEPAEGASWARVRLGEGLLLVTRHVP